MPLTFRTNGTGASNLISASWWNEYYNLITGQMADQPVRFIPNLTLQAASIGQIAGQPAATTAVSSGGSLAVGTYQYAYTLVTADGGESTPFDPASAVVTSGNQTVTYGAVRENSAATASYNIYRTQPGGSTLYFLKNTTTTSVTDDGSTNLTTSITAPTHSTFGGSLIVETLTGKTFTLSNDGTVLNDLKTTGAVFSNGKFSYGSAGDIIDANGNDTYVKARGGSAQIHFQNNGSGTANELGRVGTTGLFLTTAKLGVNDPGDILDSTTNDTYLKARGSSGKIYFQNDQGPSSTTTLGILDSNGLTLKGNSITVTSFFGIKKADGTKLAEATGNGGFIISGNTYYTSASSYNTASGGTFDGYDLAEIAQVDQLYDAGTVICPDATGVFSRCTHDGCTAAVLVVSTPGFCMGQPDENAQPVALAGRVLGKTGSSTTLHDYLCSDGAGNLRVVGTGEKVMALGVALGSSSNGMVPVLIRPTFVAL